MHITSQMAFASVGYCLASPERQLSKTVRDCLEATKVIKIETNTLFQFLIDRYPQVTQVYLGGHSAGAHLAYQGDFLKN